jgi:NhaP-type Na+/H+ or K+/H+ antiporter
MIFNALHILLTAAVTAVLVLAVGLWRLPRAEWLDAVAAGALSGPRWPCGGSRRTWARSTTMGCRASRPTTAAPILVFVAGHQARRDRRRHYGSSVSFRDPDNIALEFFAPPAS